MSQKVLAVCATMPGREATLAVMLASVRPQVDVLAVVLNGHADVPACVTQHADHIIHHSENRGAEQMFALTREWDGFYVPLADDVAYPSNYIAKMKTTAMQMDRPVCLHARTYLGANVRFTAPDRFTPFRRKLSVGYACNFAGTGTLMFHTRLGVPDIWPERNNADAQWSVWAQQAGIPVWCRARPDGWLRSLTTNGPSIYAASKSQQFADKQRQLDRVATWTVHS